MAFQKITLDGPRGTSVTGELVTDTMTHWQVAVNQQVGAYAKKDWVLRVTELAGGRFEDVFGSMFGPTHLR